MASLLPPSLGAWPEKVSTSSPVVRNGSQLLECLMSWRQLRSDQAVLNIERAGIEVGEERCVLQVHLH